MPWQRATDPGQHDPFDWMERTTGMRRTRLRPGKPLEAKRNEDGQRRERFEGLRDEPFREWIRSLPCLLAIQPGHDCWHPEKRSDAAHVESKARGAGDAGNLVPLCRRAHQEQHDYGLKSFQRVHGVNLRLIAGELWIRYEQERGVPTL